LQAAQIVADEARRHVGAGGPRVVATAGDGGAGDRAGIEALSGAPTVILADVFVVFGEFADSGCALRLVAQADVRVQPAGQPEMTTPRYRVWAERSEVPLAAWAADPELARQQYQALLRDLGGKLIDSYRQRMGCEDRGCDW
jgi:hypothetical protein